MEDRQAGNPGTALAAAQVPSAEQLPYAWNWVRIWEQVAVNVLTVVVLAILSGLVSLCVLLYQWVSAAVFVPTRLLQGIALVGLSTLLVLLVLALAVYLYVRITLRRNPALAMALAVAALGGVLFLAFAGKGRAALEKMTSGSQASGSGSAPGAPTH
jgi:hypothetical protein